MRPSAAHRSAAALALLGWAAAAAAVGEPNLSPRVEARSADLLAVGTVHGDRMTIHLSRIVDNAPVRDAALSVVLRGATHAAVAETDGSYTIQTPDLSSPGAAAVQFRVAQGATHEELAGSLDVADRPEPAGDKGNTRQLGWWVLNFAVCIGFLMLWRRRKASGS